MPPISRKDLIEVLESWQLGQVRAAHVHAWAEERYQVEQWDPEDRVVNEVLARLDSLDMNLITADDVPVLVRALISGSGQEAIDGLVRDLEALDIESRRKLLRGDPLYAPFCE